MSFSSFGSMIYCILCTITYTSHTFVRSYSIIYFVYLSCVDLKQILSYIIYSCTVLILFSYIYIHVLSITYTVFLLYFSYDFLFSVLAYVVIYFHMIFIYYVFRILCFSYAFRILSFSYAFHILCTFRILSYCTFLLVLVTVYTFIA